MKRKKIITRCGDGGYFDFAFCGVYDGDHFAMHTNFETCTPETNTMFYVNYTSIKKKKPKMRKPMRNKEQFRLNIIFAVFTCFPKLSNQRGGEARFFSWEVPCEWEEGPESWSSLSELPPGWPSIHRPKKQNCKRFERRWFHSLSGSPLSWSNKPLQSGSRFLVWPTALMLH